MKRLYVGVSLDNNSFYHPIEILLKSPKYFPVLHRNRLISGRLKPVLSHTGNSCTTSYYRKFSTNIKIKILLPVCQPCQCPSVRGKLSIICNKCTELIAKSEVKTGLKLTQIFLRNFNIQAKYFNQNYQIQKIFQDFKINFFKICTICKSNRCKINQREMGQWAVNYNSLQSLK